MSEKDNDIDFNTKNNSNKHKKKVIIALSIIGLLFIIFLIPKKNKQDKKEVSVKTNVDVPSIYEKGFEKKENEDKFEEIELTEEKKQMIREEKAMYDKRMAEKEKLQYDNINDKNNDQSNIVQDNTRKNNIADIDEKPEKEIYEYRLSREMLKRTSNEYTKMNDYFRQNMGISWKIDKNSYDRLKNSDPIERFTNVEEDLHYLYEGADKIKIIDKYQLAATSKIIAITDSKVHTDHPGQFTATIVRPMEIEGMKLLCESGQIRNKRIPVKIEKLVNVETREEYNIRGQVQMSYAGLKGKFRSRAGQRLIPDIINAGVGAGFIAWQMQKEVDSSHIDTRDAIYGPIVQTSVSGIQNEISQLPLNTKPDYMYVSKGTQFEILITETCEIKI